MTRNQGLENLLGAYDLALHDTVLFLDTHPNDAKALEAFNHFREKVEELQEQYNKCTPLTVLDNPKDSWAWGKSEWPWE